MTPTIGYDERADPNDHFAMREDPGRRATNLVIRPDMMTYWDKPIAVLIGPNSISAGELEALRASFHPRTRLFGLPAPGGNTGSIFPILSRPEWAASIATSNMFLVDGHEYLAHVGFEPDERVWLTRDDVANGIDSVVEAALNWIGRETVAAEDDPLPESTGLLSLSAYPNPFQSRLTIDFDVAARSDLDMSVFDILGRRIETLESGRSAGSVRTYWDATSLDGRPVPAGVYFIKLLAGDSVRTMAVVKVE